MEWLRGRSNVVQMGGWEFRMLRINE